MRNKKDAVSAGEWFKTHAFGITTSVVIVATFLLKTHFNEDAAIVPTFGEHVALLLWVSVGAALVTSLAFVSPLFVAFLRHRRRHKKRNGSAQSAEPHELRKVRWKPLLLGLAFGTLFAALWWLSATGRLSNVPLVGDLSTGWQIAVIFSSAVLILGGALVFRPSTEHFAYFGRALLAIAFYLTLFYFFIPRFQPGWWEWIESERMQPWLHVAVIMLAVSYVFFSGFRLMFFATAAALVVVMGFFSWDDIVEYAEAKSRTAGVDWIQYDVQGYPVCNAQEVLVPNTNPEAYGTYILSENTETCVEVNPPAHKPCFVPHIRGGSVGFQMWDEDTMDWTPLTEGTIWRPGETGFDMEYPLSSTFYWRLTAPSVSEEGLLGTVYFAVIPYGESCQGVFPRIP